MLNICLKITKPEPAYAYKHHSYKQTCTSNSFVTLRRLHATAVDCAHELINGDSPKFSKINKRGVLNKGGGRGKKRNN